MVNDLPDDPAGVEPELLLRRDGGVAVVTLNRPSRLNALTPSLMTELVRVISTMAEDAGVGCLVLTGAGRGFCAGGDLKDGGGPRPTASAARGGPIEQQSSQLRSFMEASRLLHRMAKPTIAMINGPVAGAGVGLAGACDLRFASNTASFVTAFDRIGASGDFGSTWFWTRILGSGAARELFLLGDKLSSEQAFAKGLYTRLLPQAELVEFTMAAAHRLASGPRMAWRYTKANLNFAEHADLEAALDHEALNMTLSTNAAAAIWKAAKAAKTAEAAE